MSRRRSPQRSCSPRNVCARASERGNTVIEFALLLPFILFMLGGSLGFGTLLYEKRMLAEASYVGSTAAAKLSAGTPQNALRDTVNSAIDAFLNNSRLNAADFGRIIEISTSTVAGTHPLRTVRVTVGRKVPANFSYFGEIVRGKGCNESASMLAEGDWTSLADGEIENTGPACD